MSDHQVAWNQTTKVATVQNLGATVPAGSVKIGEFEHDDLDHDGRDELGFLINHVLYHHVRDALYNIHVFNMQKIHIVDTSTLSLNDLEPTDITLTGGTPEGSTVAIITGKHSGSTLSISPDDGSIVIYGNDTIGWRLLVGSEALANGSYEYELTETLEGAQGSPRTTLIDIHVVSLVLSIGNGAGYLSMLRGMADGTTFVHGNAGGYLPAFLSGAATGKSLIKGIGGGMLPRLNGYATGTTKTSGSGSGLMSRLMGSASGMAIEKVSEGNGAGFLSFLTGSGSGSITVPDGPTIFFDDTVNNTNKTLTNSDQTFQLTSGSTNKPMFILPVVTGLVYAELTIEALGTSEIDISFGMAKNKTLTNVITDSGAVSLYQANPADGSPGSAVNPVYDRHWTNIKSWQVGDTLRLEFDSDKQSVRFALNGNPWTDKYYAADYSDGSDWLYIVAGAQKSGTRLTINGGSSEFAYAPSYGYNGPDAAPYWTFDDLTTAPLLVMDPMDITWVENNLNISMDFTTTTYSFGGTGYTIATMPGWSYSRTGASVYAMDSSGVPHLFAVNVPRITDLGLLIETASANLVRYSVDGVNAMSPYGSSTQFMGITTGQTDPSGGSGAVLFTGDGSYNTHGAKWRFDADIAYVTGHTYTFSAFVKPGTATLLQLTGPSGPFGTSQHANFTLTGSGTVNVATGGTATITKFGSWYLITFTITATSSASDHSGAVCLIATTTDPRNPVSASANTIYVWGWQIEDAATRSSLIVTAAGSASRGADVCSLTYSGTASDITLVHSTGTVNPTISSPLNLGSSSAGAWVGKYILTLDIEYDYEASIINFSSLTNTGSLGGNYSKTVGIAKRDINAINGMDGLKVSADSAIGITGAVFAGGNICVSYVCKRLGNPASNTFGAIISQSNQNPGWTIYEQIKTSATLSDGHNVVSGNVALNGWPSGSTNTDKNAIFNPPTDDADWHINTAKFGTDHLWRYDGKALTATYATDHSIPASTGDINIGTSFGGQNANLDIAFLVMNQDPTTDELFKIEGSLAWYYNLQSKLLLSHPYALGAPMTDSVPDVKEWNKTAYDAPHFVFSNKDRTAFKNTTDGAGDWSLFSRASASKGKWMASIIIDYAEYGNVGLINEDNSKFIAVNYDGAVITSGGGLGYVEAYAAPSRIDIFFDLDNSKVWFRKDSGYWNNNASYDPATNVGGLAIPASSTPWHVGGYCQYYGSAKRTLLTQTSDFTSPPSGFTPFSKARG